MTVTITSASQYSIGNSTEVAYAVTYSDGTEVRSVVSPNGWIRTEYKKNEQWVQAGKPYIVRKDKKRQGERLVEVVKDWLK